MSTAQKKIKDKKSTYFDAVRYKQTDFYDELLDDKGKPRAGAERTISYLQKYSAKHLISKQKAADLAILEMGISFTVYSDGKNIDRTWPMDIIPRIIARKEWNIMEEGLIQRITALNLFINDVYNDQKCFKDKLVPKDLIMGSKNFLPQCMGVKPKHGVWAHICGSDLVRDDNGVMYVLEDNLRIPSGVSYMLENRAITKRVLPQFFERHNITPVDDYPSKLFDMLESLAPDKRRTPEIVVMTPGIHNSAYFEHAYLAQRMGAELVQGSDLVVDDKDIVYMKTVDGLERVDVVYRRIDDDYLDPEAFLPESQLGTRGLFRAWKKGNVGLANAPGAGVADDKIIYTYVPDIIKYYLGEEPIIPNVPSYLCVDDAQRAHVLKNLKNMVVKPANESGGYGMLIGPSSSKAERDKFSELIKKSPRNYMAQPALSLSIAPTLCDGKIEGRHLDLRPFILQGKSHYVTSGGLTRVALAKGSLVVNSSQGGGSKDTWIVDTSSKSSVIKNKG